MLNNVVSCKINIHSQFDKNTLKPVITFATDERLQDQHLSNIFTPQQLNQLKNLVNKDNFNEESKFVYTVIDNQPVALLKNENEDKDKTHTAVANIKKAISTLCSTFNCSDINLIYAQNINKNTVLQLTSAISAINYNLHTRLKLKSDKKSAQPHKLENLNIIAPNSTDLSYLQVQINALLLGMQSTKDLANAPANLCTPSDLANYATALASQCSNIKTMVMDRAEIEQHNMHSFLSVTNGSKEAPKLITLEYKGSNVSAASKPIVLVGKGITFDSGGISIKPGEKMDEMKYDMCGAASVLGIFTAISAISNLDNLHILGIIPSCENMPSGTATKPGDVVFSMSGKSIEILNTDAEGRLILCDALTYAQKISQPQIIIDMATLTGACVIALGDQHSGLFSNNDKLSQQLIDAGKITNDRMWRMPTDVDPDASSNYSKQLDSNFADLGNIGGRSAGSVTAACFLSKFIDNDIPWAHLDIAGTAWISGGKEKGASARPVPALLEFILNYYN